MIKIEKIIYNKEKLLSRWTQCYSEYYENTHNKNKKKKRRKRNRGRTLKIFETEMAISKFKIEKPKDPSRICTGRR